MKTSIIGIGVVVMLSGGAEAQSDIRKFVPQYQIRPQTDSERLQNFRPPPPAPRRDTVIDRAARAYQNAPVRPSYDPKHRAPIIQYQRKF